jgi:hypothetical protein
MRLAAELSESVAFATLKAGVPSSASARKAVTTDGPEKFLGLQLAELELAREEPQIDREQVRVSTCKHSLLRKAVLVSSL